MEEQKLTHRRHVGSKPVKAEPNRDVERALEPSNPPQKLEEEIKQAPEGTTREKAVQDMDEATDHVRDKLSETSDPPYATETHLNDEQAERHAADKKRNEPD